MALISLKDEYIKIDKCPDKKFKKIKNHTLVYFISLELLLALSAFVFIYAKIRKRYATKQGRQPYFFEKLIHGYVTAVGKLRIHQTVLGMLLLDSHCFELSRQPEHILYNCQCNIF